MVTYRSLGQMLRHYGVRQGDVEAERMLAYLALLAKWNRRVNLTASTEWPALSPLVEEAVWAAGFYPGTDTTHLDIGSGAGFPAIPLRILRPRMRLWMVEPRIRRASFLETVAAELKLEETRVICERVEAFLGRQDRPQFDVISWKGLKLSTEAFSRLKVTASHTCRLWVFHGAELPFEDREVAATRLRLLRHESSPAKTGWKLSIYSVSRETL